MVAYQGITWLFAMRRNAGVRRSERWGDDNLERKAVEQEALRLALEDRTQLAQKLLLSLDVLSDEEMEDVWLTEGQPPSTRA